MDVRDIPAGARTGVWIALVTAASLVFSFALACATPFAALATVAGSRMTRGQARTTVAAAWLVNQFVGYLALGYPRTWDSFAWGAAIGLAALVATELVLAIRPPNLVALGGAFAAAFVAYEGVLLAATSVLPSGSDAFAPAVVLGILWTNLLALAVLLVLHRLAVASGFQTRPPASVA